MNWLWWGPLILLTGAGALWALRLGWIVATLTESDVISARAADYTARTGAPASDCLARPGQSRGIWILVTCQGAHGRYDYFVNRFGGVEHLEHLDQPGS